MNTSNSPSNNLLKFHGSSDTDNRAADAMSSCGEAEVKALRNRINELELELALMIETVHELRKLRELDARENRRRLR